MSLRQHKRKFFDRTYVPAERRRGYVLACILFWSMLAALFTKHCLFSRVEIIGPSMQPTLQHGEYRFLLRLPYFYRDPHPGEVVVIDRLRDGQFTVKRVIAVPGDTLEVSGGSVLVNGHLLNEAYLTPGTQTFTTRYAQEPLVVAEGHYFVMGDNRDNSEDSRFFGAVPRTVLLGYLNP